MNESVLPSSWAAYVWIVVLSLLALALILLGATWLDDGRCLGRDHPDQDVAKTMRR